MVAAELRVHLGVAWPALYLSLLLLCGAVARRGPPLHLLSGEGFIAHLDVAKDFGSIKNCWFRFQDGDKVRIDLNATEPLRTERNEDVLPYSRQVCGIRVAHLSVASAGAWTLQAESAAGHFEQKAFEVHISSAPLIDSTTHVALEVGRDGFKCSRQESHMGHCKIVDDTGASWNQCELRTPMRPSGRFECLTHLEGRMQESREHITVDVRNQTVYATPSVEEEDDARVVLRCAFEQRVLRSCRAEMPDHLSEILLMDGLYNGRYSSFDTSTSSSRCALEIPRPLLPEEIGLWRILSHEPPAPTGCLFYVGQSEEAIIKSELQSLNKESLNRVLKIYKPEGAAEQRIPEMSCSVPFVIEDCYLRDPNGTVYFPDTSRFDHSRLVGRCAFQNVSTFAGTWICGARGRAYEKEVLQKIQVVVKSRNGEQLSELVKAKRGDSVELMCRSAYEEPISHCAFIDPQSRVHLVGTENSIKTKGHVQYWGRGIGLGECGIRIGEVGRDDFGRWKCHFVLYADRRKSTFTIKLKESETVRAGSVGLGVGLTVISALVMGVVVGTVFYRRRQRTACHDLPPVQSLDNSTASIAPTETTT